jgi:hypothetical protein
MGSVKLYLPPSSYCIVRTQNLDYFHCCNRKNHEGECIHCHDLTLQESKVKGFDCKAWSPILFRCKKGDLKGVQSLPIPTCHGLLLHEIFLKVLHQLL